MKSLSEPDARKRLNFIIEHLNLGIGFRVGEIEGEEVTAIVYTIGIDTPDGETEYDQEVLAVLATPGLIGSLKFANETEEVTNAS